MREVYNKQELSKLNPNKYKRLLDVDYVTVCKMETTVSHAYEEKHKKRRKNK